MGKAFSEQKKTDESIAQYQKAIEANPKLASAYNNLGVELEKKGKTDDAKAQYRKALQIDPKYEDAIRNLERFGERPGINTPAS
jgi:superkiller protein 3